MTNYGSRIGCALIISACITCREAASDWGLQCMRYEIRDISPPAGVRAAMELQVLLNQTFLVFLHVAFCSHLFHLLHLGPAWGCIA